MVSVKYYLDQLKNLGRRVKLFTNKGLVYHYTYGRWRFARWLDSRLAKTVSPSNKAFLTKLNLEKPALSPVKQAVLAADYEQAVKLLNTYFRTRIAPQFCFTEKNIGQITSLVSSQQKAITIYDANEICQNKFCFRQVAPVHFSAGIDWTYRPHDNIDWTLDLNRHTYFQILGRAYWYTSNEKYALKFRELLLDWLANNPAGVAQPNWAEVFEVATRINTWIWAFFYFRQAAAFDDNTCLAFLKGLLRHGCYLDANLEFHVQNNHLLLEAKALAVLGLLFPEFKHAERWRQRGLEILYQQINTQVCSDGVHGERTTLYHRVITGELLELLVLLENNGLAVPSEILETFSRMVDFELGITKPDGLPPLLSDSSLEDTYLRFSGANGGSLYLGRSGIRALVPALDEGSLWLLGSWLDGHNTLVVTPVWLKSLAFPEGGYFIMRHGQTSEALYLVFDAGPFGYGPAPGHGHADALSFELYAYGQTFLVDSGFYGRSRAETGDWRNYFRSSRAHNTVVVDDQDQSILVDTWRVERPAEPTLHRWFSSDQFDFIDASHNGYERLAKPVTHRRQIFFVKPDYWIVIDSLAGQGQHCFDLYFHLMPGLGVQLEPESRVVRVGNASQPGLTIVPLVTANLQADIITGATDPIQGWVSFFSGQKQPSPTLRYRQVTTAPAQFCTLLYPHPLGSDVLLSISPPLEIKAEVDNQLPPMWKDIVSVLQVETRSYTDYLLVDRGSPGIFKAFAGYKTDAQLIYVRHEKEDGKLTKVIMRQGSQLLFQDQSLLNGNESTAEFILDYEP